MNQNNPISIHDHDGNVGSSHQSQPFVVEEADEVRTNGTAASPVAHALEEGERHDVTVASTTTNVQREGNSPNEQPLFTDQNLTAHISDDITVRDVQPTESHGASIFPTSVSVEALESLDLPNFVKNHYSTLTFPEKLMIMISHIEKMHSKSGTMMIHHEAPMEWVHDGTVVFIRDKDRLTKDWLPAFFQHTKFSSFTRKLYRWGFRQYNSPEDSSSKTLSGMYFFSALFCRNDHSLLTRMKSVTAAGTRREEAVALEARRWRHIQVNAAANDDLLVGLLHIQQQQQQQQLLLSAAAIRSSSLESSFPLQLPQGTSLISNSLLSGWNANGMLQAPVGTNHVVHPSYRVDPEAQDPTLAAFMQRLSTHTTGGVALQQQPQQFREVALLCQNESKSSNNNNNSNNTTITTTTTNNNNNIKGNTDIHNLLTSLQQGQQSTLQPEHMSMHEVQSTLNNFSPRLLHQLGVNAPNVEMQEQFARTHLLEHRQRQQQHQLSQSLALQQSSLNSQPCLPVPNATTLANDPSQTAVLLDLLTQLQQSRSEPMPCLGSRRADDRYGQK